jgi:MOSC domain-containing protein YiiM
MGRLVQINVKAATGEEAGLPKRSVPAAGVGPGGVEGDFNRYRHDQLADDPNSAVSVMTSETIRALDREGWPVRAGDLGENLTTEGIDYASMGPGRRIRVGEVEIEVTRACEPCTNLYRLPYVGIERGPKFLKTMLDRRGWYAKVTKPGTVRVGDSVELLPPLRAATP